MARKKTVKPRKSPSRKPKKDKGLIAQGLKWIFVAGLWVGIFLVLLMAWYAKDLPDITRSATFGPKLSTTILASDGTMLARYGEVRGKSLDIKDISPYVIDAVLATEDRRFYYHFGLDPIGLLRAAGTNALRGHVVQGGSTITQQLAKNLFLTQERTYKRKIQEAMLALWLEMELSKDEILSAYLNRVYMGAGTYGIEAASRLYFNKDPKDLNLRESAMIAGLLKAPSRYSPLNNPLAARERSDVVLQAMADAGYITEKEAKGLTAAPAKAPPKPGDLDGQRYFTDWIVDGVDDIIGTPEQDIIVETTLVPGIQETAEHSITDTLDKVGVDRKISQGAAVVMSPGGAVLAMVGGRNYNESKFNRAVQAKRAPGSSFKPIVYTAALEAGWKPTDVLTDAPITEGRYRPSNFGNDYYGPITIENALALSLNTIAFQLAKSIGPQAIINMARRLGIYSNLQPDLSIALGSNGASMLEMATVYATLANGGYRTIPYAIKSIKGKDGYVYYQRHDQPTNQVISSNLDYTITQMLHGPIEYGTGQAARLPYPASGKTGTSQDSRDAWFSGYTNKVVATVWMGNDDNSPMKAVTGGSYPAQIWKQIMLYANAHYNYNGIQRGNAFTQGFDNLMSRLLPSNDNEIEQQPLQDSSQSEGNKDRGFGGYLQLPRGYTPKTSHYNN